MILFSCKNNVIINIPENDIIQDYIFITLEDTINFSFTEYQKLKEIFQKADSLVIKSNNDSYTEYIGKINYYEFIYHHFESLNSKLIFDYIIVKDTINHKEIYISKFDNFLDNILKYSYLYY